MVDARHRVALHAEDRLSAERRRAHDLGLQGKPVAIAAGDVDDRPTPCSRASATAARGDIRGWPAYLSVNPTTSTVSASTAIRSLTRAASAWAGSEISADVRAVSRHDR